MIIFQLVVKLIYSCSVIYDKDSDFGSITVVDFPPKCIYMPSEKLSPEQLNQLTVLQQQQQQLLAV